MQGSLRIMKSGYGDIPVTWDTKNPQTVATSRDTFNRLKGDGWAAIAVDPKDPTKTGRPIQEFDPNDEQVTMFPPLVGG